MSAAFKICPSRPSVLLGLALLAGCTGLRQEGSVSPAASPLEQAREGEQFDLQTAESLLTIQVYRGGTLARMGHNHVVASHNLTGSAFAPADLTRASFEIRFPVSQLTVDEPELRAQAGADFVAEVPDSAREGTRKNMLGEGFLDAARYPDIVMQTQRVDVLGPNELSMHVQITARDKVNTVVVPVHYDRSAEALTASGEFVLKQSELGLTPFSVMMGALQVQDEMRVRFRFAFGRTQPSPSSSSNAVPSGEQSRPLALGSRPRGRSLENANSHS